MEGVATRSRRAPAGDASPAGAADVVVLRLGRVRRRVRWRALAAPLRELSALGVDVVVVVSGDLAILDTRAPRVPGPGRLFLCAGQEAHVVQDGVPALVWRAPPGADPVASFLDEVWGEGATAATVADGLRRAAALLESLAKRLSRFPEPVPDPAWRLEVEGFDPFREREVESWCAVANGRTGTRGSVEEGSAASAPAVYLAGFFGRAEPDGPELVPGLGWTRLAPRVAGEALSLDSGQVLEHRRVLDLRRGILFRTWRHRLPSGREARLRTARFASLADRDLMGLEAELEAGGPVALEAEVLPSPPAPPLAAVTLRSGQGCAVVELRARDGAAASFAVASAGEGGVLRRVVAVAGPGAEPPPGVEETVRRAAAEGLPRLRARHVVAWRARWRDADVVVEGDPEAQRALRFALYHLISAGDPERDLGSVGARGLTGPGYRGHVFWDTEVFVLPFLALTHPPTARALLAYRYRTLPAARDRARALGFRGALYPWESADTGEDVTPTAARLPDGTVVPVRTGALEHHVSADVAWAAWRYWQATGDRDFLLEMGAELVLETARFWSSRARRGRDGRFHIGPVIGPDEYHEDVRDNAFTNVMARWNLERGLEVLDLLGPDGRGLADQLGVRGRDLRRWREVAAGLVDGFDPETLLLEQFAGYFRLEDVRAADLAERPFAAELVLGRRRLPRSQVIKQADVVMLLHLLPELFPPEVAAANYRHYEPRCSHGSSLSPPVHATVAARVGELEEALAAFRLAAEIDLGDRMGNASQGVHLAAQGGLWQAAVFGFGGLRLEGDGLRLDPRLPPTWRRLAFPLRWRGSRLRVEATAERLVVRLFEPALVAAGDEPLRRRPAGTYEARRRSGGWAHLEEVARG